MDTTRTRQETVRACTCDHCKYSKRRKRSSFRRWYRRYLNKKRRKEKVYSHYYA